MNGLTRIAAQPRHPPRTAVPPNACDCHTHVFGPYDRFPLVAGRPYSPVPAPLPQLAGMQAGLGFGRAVIVQPSVYGTDNACTLAALGALGPRARGVAVVDPEIPDGALLALHAAGMRGVRLNLMTAGPPGRGAAAAVRHLAGRVAPLGWHLQLFCTLATTAALADTLAALPVPAVLDHFAWPAPDTTPDDPTWCTVLDLVRGGTAWVKLSAAHRMTERGVAGDSLAALTRSLVAAHPGQLLWGSDWPHPGAFIPGQTAGSLSPLHDIDDAADLDRLAGWLGDPALLARILVDNPARLYGFEGR